MPKETLGTNGNFGIGIISRFVESLLLRRSRLHIIAVVPESRPDDDVPESYADLPTTRFVPGDCGQIIVRGRASFPSLVYGGMEALLCLTKVVMAELSISVMT